MNRIETAYDTSAQPERHSPLYRREKIAENLEREDRRELSVYASSLIADRYDADLRKQFGWGF